MTRRTGQFDIKMSVFEPDSKAHAAYQMQRAMAERLFECLDDGREYIVRTYPITGTIGQSPDFQIKYTQLELRCTVLLRNWQDAAIEEECCTVWEPLDQRPMTIDGMQFVHVSKDIWRRVS